MMIVAVGYDLLRNCGKARDTDLILTYTKGAIK